MPRGPPTRPPTAPASGSLWQAGSPGRERWPRRGTPPPRSGKPHRGGWTRPVRRRMPAAPAPPLTVPPRGPPSLPRGPRGRRRNRSSAGSPAGIPRRKSDSNAYACAGLLGLHEHDVVRGRARHRDLIAAARFLHPRVEADEPQVVVAPPARQSRVVEPGRREGRVERRAVREQHVDLHGAGSLAQRERQVGARVRLAQPPRADPAGPPERGGQRVERVVGGAVELVVEGPLLAQTVVDEEGGAR